MQEAATQAAYWQMVLTYLRGINYDLPQLAHDYRAAMGTRVRDEFAAVLTATKVPLAFMGSYHAVDLVGHAATTTYRIIDVMNANLRCPYRVNESFVAFPPQFPNLSAALRQIHEQINSPAALAALQGLHKACQVIAPTLSVAPNSSYEIVMERALMLRPDLLLVQLAVDSLDRKRLRIDRHLPYLAMASNDAAAIVTGIIRQVLEGAHGFDE